MLSRGEPIDLAWMLRHDIPGGDHRTFGFCKPIIRAKKLKATDILYDDDLAMGEDYLFYGRLIIAGFRFGVTTSSGYMYSVRKTSLTLSQRDSLKNIEVNRRLHHAWARSSDDVDVLTVRRLFYIRECAFRYEDFIYAFKRKRLALAMKYMSEVPIRFLAGKGLKAAGKRLKIIFSR